MLLNYTNYSNRKKHREIYKRENFISEVNKKWPVHGTIGLILVIVFWYLNWHLSGLRTQWGFFPLWLGYSLTIDAIVFYRKGESLITRNYKSYIVLFIISAPAWWLFEVFNLRMKNWDYDGKQYFTNFQYFLLASLSFSTVMPAVFGSAEFISTFNWVKKIKPDNEAAPKKSTSLLIFIIGIFILILILLFPYYFYFLIWIALFFILDPVNVWLKNRNLLSCFAANNWKPLLTLGLGCLMCGFFWEMWNFHSYPKWIYYLPMVNFFHVFEMPILGYIGYIPFSLELFALYHLVSGFFKNKNEHYIKVL